MAVMGAGSAAREVWKDTERRRERKTERRRKRETRDWVGTERWRRMTDGANARRAFFFDKLGVKTALSLFQ